VARAIERGEECCFDICDDCGQMFDNVKHMQWFHMEVARWFKDNVKEYAGLVAT
jgi:hypothetical protein